LWVASSHQSILVLALPVVLLQVSMLDDKVWQVLAEIPAPEALAVH